jgi:hypothetical protein
VVVAVCLDDHPDDPSWYNFGGITRSSGHSFSALNPKCVVVAGFHERELDAPDKVRAFELFRSSLAGIELITFDEFFRKVEYLLQIFSLSRKAER